MGYRFAIWRNRIRIHIQSKRIDTSYQVGKIPGRYLYKLADTEYPCSQGRSDRPVAWLLALRLKKAFAYL